jgi:uncharacterized protein involved in exopolysaccharide biosynthesis
LNFILVGVVAAIVSLFLPKWYRATATVLPPRQQLGGLGLALMQNNLPLPSLGLLSGSDETLTYVALLESNTVMKAVAEKFKLGDVYQTDHIQETLRALRGNVEVEISKEGTITISVLDRDPRRAADMANAFVFYLDSLNTAIKTQKARNDRMFVEKRLTQNLRDLKAAEESFKRFQETYGAISLPEQTEAAITAAAQLEAEIIAAQVELAVQEKYLSPSHSIVINLRNRLQELENKLASMTTGGSTNSSSDEGFEIFIPFAELPDIGVKYARLLRDLETQNNLYKLLLQQYEVAKLQEAKDTPTVQVLDPAEPPYRKAKPKRAIIAILAALSATFLLAIAALFIEKLNWLKDADPVTYQKIVASMPFGASVLKRAKGGRS